MTSAQNTALLVMDMQSAMVGIIPNGASVISNTGKAISKARENKIPVIYVVVGFRPGFPEISQNNKGFVAAKERFASVDSSEFTKIHPDIAPAEGEVTVVKRRVSAFTGSDLEVLLRAYGIQHLVLCGISTGGVVLSTVREAADKDYRLTILADCCSDPDDEIHRLLITKILPRQADVITEDEWN